MTFRAVTLDWLRHRRSPSTTQSLGHTSQIDARFADTTKMRFRRLNSFLCTQIKRPSSSRSTVRRAAVTMAQALGGAAMGGKPRSFDCARTTSGTKALNAPALATRSIMFFVASLRYPSNRNFKLRTLLNDVRSYPESGHVRCTRSCLLWAKSGHFAWRYLCPLYPAPTLTAVFLVLGSVE